MVSREAARNEVVPIMDAYRAELELVRCELVDGQRQHDAIRAEVAQATRYLENEVFALVAKSREAHEMQHTAQDRYSECIARLSTTFNTFEQVAEAAAQWNKHYEALKLEGLRGTASSRRFVTSACRRKPLGSKSC